MEAELFHETSSDFYQNLRLLLPADGIRQNSTARSISITESCVVLGKVLCQSYFSAFD